MQFDLELSICDDDEEEEEEDMMVMARLWPFNLSSKHFILWSEKDTLKQAGKEIETQDCPNISVESSLQAVLPLSTYLFFIISYDTNSIIPI